MHSLLLALVLEGLEGVEVAGGDDTGGEGDEGYAEEGGEHGDTAAYGGDGVDIAIAHGGEGNGGPVEGIEKGGEGLGLDVEDDERGYEDIPHGQVAHSQQGIAGFLQGAHHQHHVLRVVHQLEDGEHAQNTQASRDSQQAEAIVNEGQSRENRQHIDNAGQRERVAEKGPDAALAKADICREPVQQVIDDEDGDNYHIRDCEYRVILLECQRQHADDDQNEHELIVQAGGQRVHLFQLYDVVYLLPYHTYLFLRFTPYIIPTAGVSTTFAGASPASPPPSRSRRISKIREFIDSRISGI